MNGKDGIMAGMALGLYLSVPFCRTKCTYCNFASDVFSRALFTKYVDRACADLRGARKMAQQLGGRFESEVDSVYLGGGTPTLLDAQQLERLFATIRQEFEVTRDAETTVECAPGTLSPKLVETLAGCGVNRVSLGVQSFVDQEAASVGRLHRQATVVEDLERLRAAGMANINIDLIAGLPHQTAASWQLSLAQTIDSGAPHVSVYMLEVDDDSRLGRELIAGGTRYHAHFVPDEDLTANFYLTACERLNAAGVRQYEISNFARDGYESVHNLKYWTRQPYLGFGVDAHSMLPSSEQPLEAVRWSTPDTLDAYRAGDLVEKTDVSVSAAVEESFFLGLRLNRGVRIDELRAQYGAENLDHAWSAAEECVAEGLLARSGETLQLTERGRLLSNEVFQRFLAPEPAY
jgi:oxygen-independent coproporphyrinogen-3 oxidase